MHSVPCLAADAAHPHRVCSSPDVFNDADYSRNPDNAWRHSLLLLCTVISRNEEGGWVVVDAGLKASSVDSGLPELEGMRGEVRVENQGDEHLKVRARARLPWPAPRPRLTRAPRSSCTLPRCATPCPPWVPCCGLCRGTATPRSTCTSGWWPSSVMRSTMCGACTGAQACEARDDGLLIL